MSRSAAASVEPARRDAYHHGDLRRALLDATLRLVEEHGLQGFTLRAAARAAGVTPGASYHHFADKEALLAALAEEGFALFRGAIEAAIREPAASARERSRNVGVGYVLFAVEHPTRFRVMVATTVDARRRKDPMATAALATYQLVRDVLVEGLQESGARAVPDAEVLGWWSVVHGLAFLAIDGHLGEAGSSAPRTRMIVGEVIAALGKEEPPDAKPSLPPGRSRKQRR
ncbi:MAG TPA: TetR/AcrR family transcriptional regulator [Polyangiaceae bacterium]|nr:TetR/AcrR family transcriptional regulator [Polyangiaceae bacterium]